MASIYISDDYFLKSSLAKTLYHEVASTLPIIDYHSHLEAADIYNNTPYHNITQLWLNSDHYIWRAMRSVGVSEYFITGDAADKAKFIQWCCVVPKLIGSPLYSWCHLELKRYFDLEMLINEQNAEFLWSQCNSVIQAKSLSPRSVLSLNNVTVLCTTDDPTSDLKYHQALKEEGFKTQVLPSFRFDSLINVQCENGFLQYLKALAECIKAPIVSIAQFESAIIQRIDHFHMHGCRTADVGINQFQYKACNENRAKQLFDMLINRSGLTQSEAVELRSYLLNIICRQFSQRGWVMQVHHGVLMNVNQRRFNELGPGTGFSVMDDSQILQPLAQFLSDLDYLRLLPKTVLYSLNPKNLWPMASLIGAFQDSDYSGKIQLGAAWWFNDHKHGMIQQMSALANLGALGGFIGMLTDSRNILSLSRHEYFRRILCDLLADWAESGDVPNDLHLLKETVRNICHDNAKQYFNF
ncbi:TPA: glucuronate isomerase [Vibrio vulnificus]|nr:glucuronate isomerase [Vibrio vulnificus]HDY8040116.1 glucuronate isomerase [Vibrio vulnificus]